VNDAAQRPGTDLWSEAALAAALFAVDPAAGAGIWVRAAPGPVRDRWLELLRGLLPEEAAWRRAPPNIADSRLLGGLDLAATIASGRPMIERGLLAEADGGVVVLAMAERITPASAARLAAVLDQGQVLLERDGLTERLNASLGLVALDEGLNEDEVPPAALTERLAFRLDLHPISAADCEPAEWNAARILAARARLAKVACKEAVSTLCAAAAALGVDSVRAPLLALRVARAAAALAGRAVVDDDDIAAAARLVLGPRATRMPAPPPPDAEPPPENKQNQEDKNQDCEQEQDRSAEPPEDAMIAAAQAALPPALLASLAAAMRGTQRPRESGRAGAPQLSKLRGRPAGSRPGSPRDGARLDLVETLRAAAPWQTLRGRTAQLQQRVAVRRDDFRVKRYRKRTQTTTIFAVDASGSSALHRLAEAKGAVELLLADCYVRRDRVALVAFRGSGAEILLPPTRSLTRAKRSLSALPGGGGTPLAAGIDAAATLADATRRGGGTPIIVLLTDGRPNIARSGAAGRPEAERDARVAARNLRAAGYPVLLVDTSPRPQQLARELAAEMGARYLALPQADAAGVSRAALALSGAVTAREARASG
jgi:magnesium chelatase subunit D